MAATTLTSPIATEPRSTTAKQLWKTGIGAGIVAAFATSAVAAIASAAGVSLDVGGKAIPAVGFGQVTLVASIIGTILAVVLNRRASRPRHPFLVTTLALTLVSIVPDVLADAATSTRFTLALTHVVAAAIVIPALASRLHD